MLRTLEKLGIPRQTFYRWYKDKLDVFIAVYKAWSEALQSWTNSESAQRELDAWCSRLSGKAWPGLFRWGVWAAARGWCARPGP